MRIVLFGMMSFFSLCLQAQTPALAQKISKLADAIEPQLIAWRRDIHEHPELSNRETRTAALVAAHLKKLGIEVKTGVAKTGVVGILKGSKPGPVVALRADMDALPVIERTKVPFASKVRSTFNGQEVGVMHACGHDSHVAILMAVAQILSEVKNDLKGTVKFIFQPAEEGPPEGEDGGAKLMVKEQVLKSPDVDVIFGLHIDAQLETGLIAYRPGGVYASVNDMKITITGKSAHGASPWYGIDPIVVAAQMINNLQTIVSRNLNITENAGIVTIGSIHGGNRSNIIPEQVEMLGTVRALTVADEKMLIDRVRKIVSGTAESMGATAKLELPYSIHYPVTANDSVLTAKMLPTLQREAGAKQVVLKIPETGAEDFSFFSQEVPGLFINLGGMPKGKDKKETADHHTPDFYLDESGFKLGAVVLSTLVTDYMNFQK